MPRWLAPWWRVPLLLVVTALLGAADAAHARVVARGSMIASDALRVPPLSADLVPSIGDPTNRTFVARITNVHLAPAVDDGLNVEMGPITLAVVDVLSGPATSFPHSITLSARRVTDPLIRVRNMADHWNGLSLQVGDVLIVAVRAAQAAGPFEAVAAVDVSSPDAPLVRDVRQAYVIEHLSASPQKRAMLRAALHSRDAFMARYAADALQRRTALGRDAGAALLGEAIDSDAIDPAARLALAGTLADAFDPDRNDDPVNDRIVATLARGFAMDADAERRPAWMGYLAACVLNEFSDAPSADQQARSALIERVTRPAPAEMVALLSALAGQDADDEQARALLHAWRRAHPQR